MDSDSIMNVRTLANALLSIEPEKVLGGSFQRRNWLGLVLSVQSYLFEYEDRTIVDAFIKEITGEIEIGNT